MTARSRDGAAPYLRATDEGVRVSVRVTPKAGADRIAGIHTDAAGTRRLALKVRAVPDNGAANTAAARLIARAFDVPKDAVSLASGATSRTKTFTISGDADRIARRAQDLTPP